MEKQTILGISNLEDGVRYIFEKKNSYYEFLLSLLKAISVSSLPDLYDENGKLPEVLSAKDKAFHWKSEDTEIDEVIGAEKIFLIVRTKHLDKLRQFIGENTEFKQ